MAAALGVLGCVTAVVAVAIITRGHGDLKPWHTARLEHEFSVRRDGDRLDLDGYRALEQRLSAELETKVCVPATRDPGSIANRFVQGSPSDPARFGRAWNRTSVERPANPTGSVLMLHGLTDSPYSLRAVGELYRSRGYAVVGLRLPGHGTAPGGLVTVRWEDWVGAAELGLAEARRLAAGGPLHIVGYSNGAPVALACATQALREGSRAPDQLVLISPEMAVTPVARFARWLDLVSWLPWSAKARWQEVAPECDPFKYNSFPMNAGRQAWELTESVRRKLERDATDGTMSRFPPVLAFQSVVDATVAAPAVVTRLFRLLPANGSELVLFDLNRLPGVERLLIPATDAVLDAALALTPSRFRLVIVTNRAPGDSDVVTRTRLPGSGSITERPTGMSWPQGVFSLSHVALPFPEDDPVYGRAAQAGSAPEGSTDRQPWLGERATLESSQDILVRLRHNPFFPLVRREIGKTLDRASPGS